MGVGFYCSLQVMRVQVSRAKQVDCERTRQWIQAPTKQILTLSKADFYIMDCELSKDRICDLTNAKAK